MERQGQLHGHEGHCRAWATQSPQEKHVKPGGDHSIVEELLNFSDVMEDDAGMAADGEGVMEVAGVKYSADSTTVDRSTKSFSRGSDSRFSKELICRSLTDSRISEDLCETYDELDELAELEWLSNFVEDSFSNEELHKQQLISGIKTTASEPTYQPNYPFAVVTSVAAADDESPPFTSEAMLPGKTSRKRVHTVQGNWSTPLVAPSTESSSSDFSDTAIIQPIPMEQPAKKRELAQVPIVNGRKCLHCSTDKTPQWRAGPDGPKTLCNACGVRYKSGRLVPEYRPAASPTFVISEHSNSHRKVLELRRQKEAHLQQFLPPYDNAITSVVVPDEFLINHHLHHPDYRPIF